MVEVLTRPPGPGRPTIAYTADQLRFAASRKVLKAEPGGRWGCVVPGLLGVVFSIGAAAGGGGIARALALAASALALVMFVLAQLRLPRHPGAPVDRAGFASMLERWRRVYGSYPPGLLAGRPRRVASPSTPPRAVLFCPDQDIVAFLDAAGVAERCATVLIPGGPQLPPEPVVRAVRDGLPVLVLHDADLEGCLTGPRLRAALPPAATVLDIGLRPRAAAGAGPTLRRRLTRGQRRLLESDTTLRADERSWLAEGHSLPLAAVRPARLLLAVERAIERAAPDPAATAAERLGFLDWPEAAR